jgi:uncharacterized protein (TIGR02246 family)
MPQTVGRWTRVVATLSLSTCILCPALVARGSTPADFKPAAAMVAAIASAEPTIERANSAWLPAMMRGDARALAAPYADDGLLITAAGVTVRGRAAIAAFYRRDLRGLGRISGGGLVEDGVTFSEGLIYEWGRGWVIFRHQSGAPARGGGAYLTVWRRSTDGRWQIIRNLVL